MEWRKDPPNFYGYDTQSFSSLQDSRKLTGHHMVFACHSNVPEVYTCENCDFETNLRVSLTHHLNLYHKNLENQTKLRNVLRQCGNCYFQTYSMLFMLKHSFECNNRENFETDGINDKIINRLECGQYSYVTKTKRYLGEHPMKMHAMNFTILHFEKSSSETKNKLYFRQPLKQQKIHPDSADVVWYQCEKCEFKSKRKFDLKRHIKNIHTDSTNILWYHCDVCKFKTKRKYLLKEHTTNMHTDSANIVWNHCDKCEYKTKRKSDLKRHLKHIHTDSANIMWYHCDKCKFKTKRKYLLKEHTANMHTDSANIMWNHCDKCEYKTKWKSDLKRHLKHMHTDSANIV